jgi:hypothetical protein
MAHAYKKGGEPLQRKLAESFFTGYFENEQDPGQRPYLVKTTVETGIFASEDEANQFFDSSAFDKEVNDGYRQAKELGISGGVLGGVQEVEQGKKGGRRAAVRRDGRRWGLRGWQGVRSLRIPCTF